MCSHEANHGGGGGYKPCFVQGLFYFFWIVQVEPLKFFANPFLQRPFSIGFFVQMFGEFKQTSASHLVTLCTWETGNEKKMVVVQKNSHDVGNGTWIRELEGSMSELIFLIVTFITSYYVLHIIMKLIDVVQVCLRKVVTSEFRRVYDICLAIVKYFAGMRRVWFAICNINLNQPMYDLMTWILY